MRKAWDTHYLNLCFSVVSKTSPLPVKVGVIIVKNHRILATGNNNSIHHAIINALLRTSEELEGATIYCTHEPCGDCTKEINRMKIDTIVFANSISCEGVPI